MRGYSIIYKSTSHAAGDFDVKVINYVTDQRWSQSYFPMQTGWVKRYFLCRWEELSKIKIFIYKLPMKQVKYKNRECNNSFSVSLRALRKWKWRLCNINLLLVNF